MKLINRIKKMHPVLWLNSVFANYRFIGLVNLVIAALIVHGHFSANKAASAEHLDLGISWYTLLMDQGIIAAGWIIYLQQKKSNDRIEKKLDELLKRKAAKKK